LVLVLQAAATVVALRRTWPVLVGIAAVWPVLYGTVVAGIAAPADHLAAAATALGVLLVGLATAVCASRRDPVPLPRGLLIGLLVASTFAAAVDGWAGATLSPTSARCCCLPPRHCRTAKLILFDLVALDGLARVAAFLGAGLLLAAGTRHARLVAEAEPAAVEEESPRV
jgi:hypothetical protein